MWATFGATVSNIAARTRLDPGELLHLVMQINQDSAGETPQDLEAAFGAAGLDRGGDDATHRHHNEDHGGRQSEPIPQPVLTVR